MNSEMPKFPVTDWEKLPMIVLEKTLEETKEKFAEYNSETQSVTDKSIKMLLGEVSFVSVVGGIISSTHPTGVINIIVISILSLAFIYLFYLLYSIIKSRKTQLAGVLPEYHLTSDYDDESFNNEDKERLVYLNLTKTYVGMIKSIGEINALRAKKYDRNFALGLILVLATSVYAMCLR